MSPRGSVPDPASTEAEDPAVPLHLERARWLSDELVRVRADLAASRRTAARIEAERDAARAELARLRGRAGVRLAMRLSAAVRSLTRRRGGAGRTAERPTQGSATQTATRSPLDPRGPEAFRRAFRAGLDAVPGAGPLRVVVAGLPGGADIAAFARPGWAVAAAGEVATPDVLIAFTPGVDPRSAPDGTAAVAIVAGDDVPRWFDGPAFDDFDVVVTSDTATADAIARGSAQTATALASDPGDLAAVGRTVHEALIRWIEAERIDIAIGPPDASVAERWGDYHFGRALQRALRRQGHPTGLRFRDAWASGAARHADAVIHVFGLRARASDPEQLNVLWIISHPDRVTDEQLAASDLVYVASDRFADHVRTRTERPVHVLHQATDPDRFRPTTGGPHHDILLVAGRRAERRITIDELAPTPLDFAVYGHGWTPDELPPRHHRGEHIPNDRLAAWYGAADIVLNDHWSDMAAWGFMSNRLYDAAASGAFVLSDHVEEIAAEFDGGIATFRDGPDLRRQVARYLADPAERAAMSRRARDAVLAAHTFDHRAATLLGGIGPALAARRAARGATESDRATAATVADRR